MPPSVQNPLDHFTESIPVSPATCIDDSNPLFPASSEKPAQAIMPTATSTHDPSECNARTSSPARSIGSSTSIGSKKRSHAATEDAQTAMTQNKRVKRAATKTAAMVPRLTPPPATRSSGRSRKAPARLIDLAPPPKFKAPPSRKTAGSKVFDPVYITTNANSRLKKTDVFHLLLEPRAWICLPPDQKLEILALLPKNIMNTKLAAELREGTAADNARPREFDINFNLFRTDVAKFKEDLENGHLGKTWQASAEQAIVDRAAGKFDVWKERQSERWWGQN